MRGKRKFKNVTSTSRIALMLQKSKLSTSSSEQNILPDDKDQNSSYLDSDKSKGNETNNQVGGNEIEHDTHLQGIANKEIRKVTDLESLKQRVELLNGKMNDPPCSLAKTKIRSTQNHLLLKKHDTTHSDKKCEISNSAGNEDNSVATPAEAIDTKLLQEIYKLNGLITGVLRSQTIFGERLDHVEKIVTAVRQHQLVEKSCLFSSLSDHKSRLQQELNNVNFLLNFNYNRNSNDNTPKSSTQSDLTCNVQTESILLQDNIGEPKLDKCNLGNDKPEVTTVHDLQTNRDVLTNVIFYGIPLPNAQNTENLLTYNNLDLKDNPVMKLKDKCVETQNEEQSTKDNKKNTKKLSTLKKIQVKKTFKRKYVIENKPVSIVSYDNAPVSIADKVSDEALNTDDKKMNLKLPMLRNLKRHSTNNKITKVESKSLPCNGANINNDGATSLLDNRVISKRGRTARRSRGRRSNSSGLGSRRVGVPKCITSSPLATSVEDTLNISGSFNFPEDEKNNLSTDTLRAYEKELLLKYPNYFK